MYCKSISYILALTVNVYHIYWHWLLTTDPGSQLAHQALIECAHPVLPAGDLLLRPTSLYICDVQIFILYIFISAMCSLDFSLCFLLHFIAVLPPSYLYISAILYIFQLYCRPISFSFLSHTSGNVNITDYYTDCMLVFMVSTEALIMLVGLYCGVVLHGFYCGAHSDLAQCH